MRQSKFRKLLIENCKAIFDRFFSEDGQRIIKGKDEEQILKFKEAFFNNVKFIGELSNRLLIVDQIIFSIFDQLLNSEAANDDTVESAINLIEKVGPQFDQKLEAIRQKMNATPKG